MSTAPTDASAAKITVVVLPCPKCPRTHHIGVTLLDEPFAEPSYTIPEYCPCGERLNTPVHHADIRDTACRMMEAGY